MLRVLAAVWQELRPRQWLKNSFIWAGIVFSQTLFSPGYFLTVLGAFIAFCFLASSVYLLNDITDLEEDRQHPKKSQRPLASGQISPALVWVLFLCLAAGSLSACFMLDAAFGCLALLYFCLNLAYSVYLKHQVILDAFCIAAFFVIRVAAGAVVIKVPVSAWLLVCTILLSLFIAFSKRRHELVLLDDEATSHRPVLSHYSPYLLDQLISVVTPTTVMAYALYTMSSSTVAKFGGGLILTWPFVLYGIFRYLYLIHKKESGGSPTQMVITDRPLFLTLIGWGLVALLVVYFKPDLGGFFRVVF